MKQNDKLVNIIFGCVGLSAMKSTFHVNKLLKQVLDLGISHFDTSPLYGRGYSELLLGSFSKKVGRKNIIITSKFGLGNCKIPKISPSFALPLNFYKKRFLDKKETNYSNLPSTKPTLHQRIITKNDIVSSLTRTLNRLKTDYLDYFFLHEGIPSFIDDEGKEYLQKLKEKGIVLNLGIASNYHFIKEINKDELNIFDVLQYEANLTENELISKFPNMKHFGHSILKEIPNQKYPPDIKEQEKAGYLLSKVLNNSSFNKILFSTRNIAHLKDNVAIINKS